MPDLKIECARSCARTAIKGREEMGTGILPARQIALRLLLAVIVPTIMITGCGGTSSATSNAAPNVSINGTQYIDNGSTVGVEGFENQTSKYGYQYGGPTVVVEMNDTTSGNSLRFEAISTVDGFPEIDSLTGTSGTTAYITDKSVSTGGNMGDFANGSSTGGTISIDSFGAAGQRIIGSYNVNLCDSNTICSASVKNYTGNFNVIHTANYGSLSRPAQVSVPITSPYTDGIHPATGTNFYAITTNASGGTLTVTLTPALTGDVNMAVYTDAGFATTATCDVTSTLNVVGNGAETCAITVTANQKVYVTVSQILAATDWETYMLNVAE